MQRFASLKEAVLSDREERYWLSTGCHSTITWPPSNAQTKLSGADVVHLEALLGGDDQSSIIIERYETTNQSARDTVIAQGGTRCHEIAMWLI